MEELGIGRPSTYASTLSVLRDRDYVRLEKKQLIPEDKGRLVTAFLESFFERYVEYDFTADLEEKLDQISAGELSWKEVLRDFWRALLRRRRRDQGPARRRGARRAERAARPAHLPAARRRRRSAPAARPAAPASLSLKLGKFGAFIGCSNYPECRFTRQLAVGGENGNGDDAGGDGTRELGNDPETGLDVTLRTGRFGPYVQLGEADGDGEKPKRAEPAQGLGRRRPSTSSDALTLLALPREVGIHPETGKPIIAGIGRYGPFVQHDGTYANLDSVEEVFTVGLNRAVTLLAEKQAGGGRRRPRRRRRR